MRPIDKWRPLSREPTFTAEERREAVEVLDGVLALLLGSADATICALLDKCAVRPQATQLTVDTVAKLKQLIKTRLGGAVTVRQWLVNQGYPAAGSSSDVRGRVFSVRYRWVSALKKEMQDERTGGGGNVPHKKRASRKAVRGGRRPR